MVPDDRPSRRRFVRSLGVALCGLGVAGCSGGEQTEAPVPTSAADRSQSPTEASPTTTAKPTRTTTETTTVPTTDGDRPDWFDQYETTLVRVQTPTGDRLGAIRAAIADTPDLRYRGLSGKPELPPDTGMLFVFEVASDHTFVMREMTFGIDIVFADSAGVVTGIRHARPPNPGEDGEALRHPGFGRYVLEVPAEWTTRHGVATGDVLHTSVIE